MSGEITAILGVGVALAGLILTSVRRLRQDMQAQIGGLRREIAQLRERMGICQPSWCWFQARGNL